MIMKAALGRGPVVVADVAVAACAWLWWVAVGPVAVLAVEGVR